MVSADASAVKETGGRVGLICLFLARGRILGSTRGVLKRRLQRTTSVSHIRRPVDHESVSGRIRSVTSNSKHCSIAFTRYFIKHSPICPVLGGEPQFHATKQSSRCSEELTAAFGNSDSVFQDMNVKAIFKGVTYESLRSRVHAHRE